MSVALTLQIASFAKSALGRQLKCLEASLMSTQSGRCPWGNDAPERITSQTFLSNAAGVTDAIHCFSVTTGKVIAAQLVLRKCSDRLVCSVALLRGFLAAMLTQNQ